MKFLKKEVWDHLNVLDWRARFFVESFDESLSVRTPHFHQAKMMGVIDLANEVLENIKLFEDNDKGKGYLTSSLKELKVALKSDLVARNVFGDLVEVFDDCVNSLQSEKFPNSLIIQLSILCKRIMIEKENYFNHLEILLLEAVCAERDLTKKESITDEINSLTRVYVTFLLSSGYSPTYLYNKSELLTRRNNYNERNFRDQFKFFLTSLDCKKRDFHVFFGVKTNKKNTIENYTPFKGVKVLTDIPEKHFTISTKTFSTFEPDLYLKVSVNSLDYVGASLLASERIESEIDLINTLSSKMNIDVHKSCYVEYKTKGYTYQREVHFSLLNSLLTYDHRSSQLSRFLSFDFRERLDLLSVRKIEGVLKNISLVKKSSRLEQKLLNLWISLESLNYAGDDKSIIASILNFLPKIYAIQSIEQRVNYALTLLSKLEVNIPNTIRERHAIEQEIFDNKIPLNKFYDVLICEQSAREICNALNGLDFAYYRFYGLYKIISDKKEVKLRIKNTKENVENQLYRIYRKRNNVVHIGFSEDLSHYAINHLSDYVNTLLLLIFEVISRSNHLKEITLNDILLSTQLIIDNKFKVIEKNSIEKYADLKFNVIL